MKQHVYLYIDGNKADLNDEDLILFTYQSEDADNPSVVVNSYTKTVTLPSTPANNAIFDHIIQNDHNVRAGVFSPIVRTPFDIYSQTGERLEHGYIKLDNMTDTDGQRAYNITLFGGMGGLLYGLMYDANGKERTLATLDFSTLTPPLADSDIEFNVNIDEVSDAWEDLCLAAGNDDRWDLFNFAPMYNGTPKGFDAKKIVANYQAVPGVTTSANADGYSPANVVSGTPGAGDVLVTLPDETDEWKIRDLRSYLQRPVVNVQKLLDAIVADVSAAGYTFNVDAAVNNVFNDIWMTLPMLSSSITTTGDGGRVAIPSASVTLQYGIASGTVFLSTASVPSVSREESVAVTAGITFAGSFTSGNDYYLDNGGSTRAFYLVQLIARDGTGAIAASKIVSISNVTETTASLIAIAKAAGTNPLSASFVEPDTNAGAHYEAYAHATSSSSATLYDTNNVALSIPLRCTAHNVTSWRVYVQRFMINNPSSYDVIFGTGGGTVQVRMTATASGTDDYAEKGVMTNSVVTKDILLGATMSPCAFVVGIARQYGFKLHYDAPTRTLSMMTRDAYYNGTVVNLDGRIDRSAEQSAQPYVFAHRFFRWALSPVGDTAEQSVTPYGGMTVDTSFPFDNDTADVLDGVAMQTAADILERDVEFNLLQKGVGKYISAYLKGGAKYTLFNGSGNKSYDVPSVDDTYTITPLLSAFPSYDHYPKIDMRDADGFVLVKYAGRANESAYGVSANNIHLTDDTPAMLSMNNGTPCWRFNFGGQYAVAYDREKRITDESTHASGTVPLPLFNRIAGGWSGGAWVATDTLEMAVPEDIGIPAVDTSALSGLYKQGWDKFVADRYDVDTRVVTCRVFWRGIPVDNGALRKLYTFDGSLWVLQRIEDYSLTAELPTKCTFVKVKIKTNYTNGQSY